VGVAGVSSRGLCPVYPVVPVVGLAVGAVEVGALVGVGALEVGAFGFWAGVGVGAAFGWGWGSWGWGGGNVNVNVNRNVNINGRGNFDRNVRTTNNLRQARGDPGRTGRGTGSAGRGGRSGRGTGNVSPRRSARFKRPQFRECQKRLIPCRKFAQQRIP